MNMHDRLRMAQRELETHEKAMTASRERRNVVIQRALDEGLSQREVAAVLGLTQAAVQLIARAHVRDVA